LLFIEHDELRFTPRLARAPDITPELEIGFVIASSDKIFARHFRGIFLGHRHFRRLNAGRRGFAAGQEQQREKNSEQRKDAPHLAECVSQPRHERNVVLSFCFRGRLRKFEE
jgi:hypothetical protein